MSSKLLLSSSGRFCVPHLFSHPKRAMCWLKRHRTSLRRHLTVFWYILVERRCAYPFALSETKCKVVCSSSLQSERAISGYALLSHCVFFGTWPSSCQHVFWVGMAGWELSKLPAASHASCLAVAGWDGCHSTQLAKFRSDVGQGKKKEERNHNFIHHLPISLEVREWHQLMTVGRRRHQRWHKSSMFQASGGIMQGLLLYRR